MRLMERKSLSFQGSEIIEARKRYLSESVRFKRRLHAEMAKAKSVKSKKNSRF